MAVNLNAGLRGAPDAMGSVLGTAGNLQGLQMNQQNMKIQQEQHQAQKDAVMAQQQAAQAEQGIRQQAGEVLERDDPAEIAQFMIKHPNIGKDLVGGMNFKNEEAVNKRLSYAKQVISGQVEEVDLVDNLKQKIKDIEAGGGNAEGLKETLKLGIDGIKKAAWTDLSILDPDHSISAQKAMGYGQEEAMTAYERASVDVRRESNLLREMELSLKNEANSDRRDKIKEDIAEKKLNIAEKNRDRDEKSDKKAMAAKSVVDTGNDALRLIEKIRSHEGLQGTVGVKGGAHLFGLLDEPISGTKSAGARALIETLDAQSFIAAIGNAKAAGMSGALSDNEGRKLSKSIASLDTAQTEEDFLIAIGEIEAIISRQIGNATQTEKRRLARLSGSEKIKEPVNISTMSDEDLFN